MLFEQYVSNLLHTLTDLVDIATSTLHRKDSILGNLTLFVCAYWLIDSLLQRSRTRAHKF